MNDLNSYFDKIYCINLHRRLDRWNACSEEFTKHGLTVERIDAVDGLLLPNNNPNVAPGEIACCMSHASVLRNIIDHGWEKTLVLEDDVLFIDNLQSTFKRIQENIPDDWSLLYFGGNHANPPKFVNNAISKVSRTLCTHSYGISLNMAKAMLTHAERLEKPIDVVYVNGQKSWPCYAVKPTLATQRPSFSDVQNGEVNYTGMIK